MSQKASLKNPLVSVIITTKNEASNIVSLLKSLKNQTYKDIEIIIVDNNSTDNTKQLANKFTDQVYNFGPERSAQRNYGAQKARGKYLLILDADMILDKRVIQDCVEVARVSKVLTLVIPEQSFGEGVWSKIKTFERSFYIGDSFVEAARFFDKQVFTEFKGYDQAITGPEDYELPYRISKQYPIGRINSFIYHNEKKQSLWKMMKKKYYYASKAAPYLKKHPELLFKQGNLVFRRAFFKDWSKLIAHPFLTIGLFFMRAMEMLAAVLGFIKGQLL